MENTDNKLLTNETEQLLKRYMAAAAKLYGIIPLNKLLSIYNSQNDPISEEQFLSFIDSFDFSHEIFDLVSDDEVFEDEPKTLPMNRNLAAQHFYIFGNFDEYCEVLEQQQGKPYYIPEKEKFLKYEDQFYFEKSLEFISLRAYIRNQPYLTKERADEIAEEILLCMAEENTVDSIDYAIADAERMGLKVKNHQIYDELSELCHDVMMNTRKHIHRGHTAVEIV